MPTGTDLGCFVLLKIGHKELKCIKQSSLVFSANDVCHYTNLSALPVLILRFSDLTFHVTHI